MVCYIRSRSSSRSTVHKTGLPIAALDISPYQTHAILAGRDILKTVRVDGANCTEDSNLRADIIAYAAAHNSSKDALAAKHKDQLAATDVKWSHGRFDSTIATAAANGRIVIYDINRAGVELARLHEHTRQVHRVAFNPYQGALLLSGSQDSTIRMWDMRDLAGARSVMTCRSIKRFSGNNEGIRDLKWSPSDGVEFAAGTDNGVIQQWDFRKENAPILKMNAHDKTCHSIDWHPSGQYLATGGADKNVKIWNFKSGDRRMKPSWQLRTPQAVLNVRWRPTSDASGEGNQPMQQSVFLATSYDQRDPRIHLWDLRRPHVIHQEIDRYDTPATDILWRSEDLLWSVGLAGVFTQTDMGFVPKSMERRNVNIPSTAPNGQMLLFSAPRPRRRPSFSAEAHFHSRRDTGGSSGEKYSSSHSATDGSLEEPSVLTSSLKLRRQKSSVARGLNTPPSSHSNVTMTTLEDVVKAKSHYQPTQTAAYGHVPGVFDYEAFQYLAKHYQHPWLLRTQDAQCNVHECMLRIFEENSHVAAHTGQYRLAQSWQILGFVIHRELKERAERALQYRRSIPTHPEIQTVSSPPVERPSKQPSHKVEKPAEKSTFTSNIESTSNMPTPLARPLQEHSNIPSIAEDMLDSINSGSNGLLDVSTSEKQALKPEEFKLLPEPATKSGSSQKSNVPGIGYLEEYEQGRTTPPTMATFSDIDEQMLERRAAIANYRAKPRQVLQLDDPFGMHRNLTVIPRLDRHDSNESFQMFSASSDSDKNSMSLAGSFGESLKSEGSDPIQGEWAASHRQTEQGQDGLQDNEDPNNSVGNARIYNGSVLHEDEDILNNFEPVVVLPQPLEEIHRPANLIPPKVHLRGLQSENAKNDQSDEQQTCHIPRDFESPTIASNNAAPYSATALISELISYHLNSLSDAQLPSFLILYLSPYFPALFNPPLTTNILFAYHQQLLSLRLFVEAADLRNNCYPQFPEIWERGISNNKNAGWFCNTCNKAVKGDKPWFCERCKQPWGLCPICESVGSPLPFPDPASQQTGTAGQHDSEEQPRRSKLWAWCQDCGHGGHDSCLRLWFSDPVGSEGACPCIGCLHDCMPGIRRDERRKALEAEKQAAKVKAGGVKKDGWVVGESRAVERARGLVGSSGVGGKAAEGGRKAGGRSSTLSGGTGAKKVRLVVPPLERARSDGSVEEERGEEETSRSVP